MNLNGTGVIVCGGATAGAGAALLFARAGARVTLLEKVEQPRAVGAGIALAENGLAVLESLGFAGALAAGRPVTDMRITDGAGRTLVAAPRPGPRIVMVRRSTLQGMLLDALAREPGVDARFGAEVLSADADGRVMVREGGATRELRGDLVIGADGANSRVREDSHAAFGARLGTGVRYVRALVESDAALGVEAWTPAGLFGSFAVDGGGSYMFSSCGTPALRAALDARDVGAYRRAWVAAYPASAPLLASLRSWDPVLVNEVIRVQCRTFVHERIALIGDAAHAMAPNLGQGANSALVDAAVLVDELRRGANVPAGLAAYDARRRRPVQRVADTAGRMGALAEVTSPLGRALRDRVLLPIVSLLPTGAATRALLQEPTETLRAIAT